MKLMPGRTTEQVRKISQAYAEGINAYTATDAGVVKVVDAGDSKSKNEDSESD